MALVPSSNRKHRIYQPSWVRNYPLPGDEQAQCRSRLLAKIHAAYRKALKRLTVKARRRFLSSGGGGGGFSFGLLDPVSNILISTLAVTTAPRRNNNAHHAQHAVPPLEDMARRSLHGLVTFLTLPLRIRGPALPPAHRR